MTVLRHRAQAPHQQHHLVHALLAGLQDFRVCLAVTGRLMRTYGKTNVYMPCVVAIAEATVHKQ
jgi:hypothetical protein